MEVKVYEKKNLFCFLQALRKKVEEGERRTADFRKRGHF
jgi:hypothetical protein